MVELSKIERLAEIKSIVKGLDAEAKLLQKEILAGDDAPEKVKTSYGTLSLTNRETWECADKTQLYDNLGKEGYIASSTVTISNVKKQFGETRLEMLKALDVFTLKGVSQYYTLRK